MLSREKRMDLRNSWTFKKTNRMWNDYKFNHAWSISYLNNLCKLSKATTFEEWESYYLKSGEERKKLLEILPKRKQEILNKRYYDKDYDINIEEKEINTMMGRTMDDLKHITRLMQTELVKIGIKDIDFNLCLNFVYIRVIDETWIGRQREINTVKTLEKIFEDYRFIETSLACDVKYAVDYEINKDNLLICGIQIKSDVNYRKIQEGESGALKTIQTNYSKNKRYIELKKRKVIYVYSTINGEIVNEDCLQEIKELADNISISV